MFLFWFWHMLLPKILGNLVLLADVIAMLPFCLQLMFSVLAGVNSVPEKIQLIYIKSSKMRSIHAHISIFVFSS